MHDEGNLAGHSNTHGTHRWKCTAEVALSEPHRWNRRLIVLKALGISSAAASKKIC